LGITAPVGSVTVPKIEPYTACPKLCPGNNSTKLQRRIRREANLARIIFF